MNKSSRAASALACVLIAGLFSACGGGDSGDGGMTMPQLVSIAITPSPFATCVGVARQLTATGTYSNHTTAVLTTSVTWSSTSGVTVASGLVTGVSLGSATVTATSGNVSSSVQVSITSGVWSLAGSMAAARLGPPATLLSNGQVLVAAFVNSSNANQLQATVYDPATDAWSLTQSMTAIRESPTATLLGSGQVLVTGGAPSGGGPPALATTELYDPASNAWSAGPSMSTGRYQHTATLLTNGKVLVAGGTDNAQGLGCSVAYTSAELYDPTAGTWSAVASMTTGHFDHTATLLTNGTVLITGGYTCPPGGGAEVATGDTEIYDPVADSWTVVGGLNTPRADHAMAQLPNGSVLVAGGNGLASAEIYNPAATSWTVAASMSTVRSSHTLTVLPNGTVIAVAGLGTGGLPAYLASAEVYDPVANSWSPTGSLNFARYGHTATLLNNGVLLVTGGAVQANPNVSDPFGNWQSSTELYW